MHPGSSNSFYVHFDEEPFGSTSPAGQTEYRSVFQINRDRIIHTSAFRRLQNKTQVFLAGDYDFYRTRLTHSIEVAQIGRSICQRLLHTSALLSDEYFIDPDLVEAACLAHDIGHPPFGHAGERSLNALMAKLGGFEGNAQTLRLLTRTIFGGDRGMMPCRALLDSILKYKTLHRDLDNPQNHFLYSDQQEILAFTLGDQSFPPDLTPGVMRDSSRSVECQIMDWADDTAYSLNDIADGIAAGFINIERLERWASSQNLSDDMADHLTNLCRMIREGKVEPRLGRKIGSFIASVSLHHTPDRFLATLTNRHAYVLRIDPEARAEAELYKRIALELVFQTPQLQQFDLKGRHVLERLFDSYMRHHVLQTAGASSQQLKLLPPTIASRIRSEPEEHARARLVCDYLANMTDGFASRTYRRMFDPDFGSIMDLV